MLLLLLGGLSCTPPNDDDACWRPDDEIDEAAMDGEYRSVAVAAPAIVVPVAAAPVPSEEPARAEAAAPVNPGMPAGGTLPVTRQFEFGIWFWFCAV